METGGLHRREAIPALPCATLPGLPWSLVFRVEHAREWKDLERAGERALKEQKGDARVSPTSWFYVPPRVWMVP